jgi:hypothetical protein
MKSYSEELNLQKPMTDRVYLYWRFDRGFFTLQLLVNEQVS